MQFMVILSFSFLVGLVYLTGAQRQSPGVWDALEHMKGNKQGLRVDEIIELHNNAQPGTDFPILAEIPDTAFTCNSVRQPGFYADTDTRCQVIRRCDVNNILWSYLCPNMTLFNQITLVCDWFWNVDCARAKDFYDYSNSRLYRENSVLLDNAEMTIQSIQGSASSNAQAAKTPRRRNTGTSSAGRRNKPNGVRNSNSSQLTINL